MTNKVEMAQTNSRRRPLSSRDSTAELSSELGEYELVITGSGVMSSFPLPKGVDLLVGRSEQADLCLASSAVSRLHARIRLLEHELVIEDLSSSNGTIVHGQRLRPNQKVSIARGESVLVGDFTLVLRTRLSKCASPLGSGSPQQDVVVLRSVAMLDVYERVAAVARSEMNVLLLGETGVGKDVLARMIHERSPRREHPLLCLNCAAFSETLLESELFGYERGAFTGAVCRKPGLLSTATQGSVFLDEVGELPLALQAKLLQVIENQEVLSVGALKPRPIDVRFIAATNRDLEQAIAAGSFRNDLYFRLAAFAIWVPPLRMRKDDILPLAEEFIRRSCARTSSATIPAIRNDAASRLLQHSWPGNVRELRNVIDRALVLSNGAELKAEHLLLSQQRTSGAAVEPQPIATDAQRMPVVPFSQRELDDRQRIIDSLSVCGGNQSRAAAMLGISRSTLVNRLATYRIERPRKGST